MKIAISIENLSKKYLINQGQRRRSETLREEMASIIKGAWERPSEKGKIDFWALKDVSFEVKQGERIGIIGRNGAGKSTLLKILSRITEPTKGRIFINGRIASLLEVGTGFHPELSGRENIYLNGAILGMKRHEIRRKFDEIVEFAEVERFLDNPVKRYSSGMYVKLAFAVAAHLEPDILIVDEVLAVGDLAFQKKCISKMQKAGEDGTTVLFVSHNIAALQNLCDSAILLNEGKLLAQDDISSIIKRYLSQSSQLVKMPLEERSDRTGDGRIRFTSVDLLDERGERIQALQSGQNARLLIRFRKACDHAFKNVTFAVGVDNESGQRIAYFGNDLVGETFENVAAAASAFELKIERFPLVQGAYTLTLYCSADGKILDWIQNAVAIQVETGDFYGTGRLPPVASQGYLLIPHRFQVQNS